jgi:tetratricopeptide (TPR) repeat protein
MLLALPALADSPADLVERGNRALADGKAQEALDTYDEASVQMPESDRIQFDRGVALFRLEDYAQAREAFDAAALKTRDLPLEARCKYNLGNCAFREAERQKDSDIRKAIEQYENCIRYYQDALKLDPELTDAAHNIEVTRLILKDLLDQLKKQQEEQKKQQEEQQKLVEKLRELVERQKKAVKDNQALADQKPQPQDFGEQASKQADAQRDLKDETQELSTKMPQPQQQAGQPPTPADDVKKLLDEGAGEQALAEARLRKPDLDEARPSQERAAEKLQEALDKMTGQQQPQQGDQQQQQDQQPEEQQQAQAPRDEKAHDILDEEKDNRERRKSRAPAGHRPVDKDW